VKDVKIGRIKAKPSYPKRETSQMERGYIMEIECNDHHEKD
jgi:hypothetical protein